MSRRPLADRGDTPTTPPIDDAVVIAMRALVHDTIRQALGAGITPGVVLTWTAHSLTWSETGVPH